MPVAQGVAINNMHHDVAPRLPPAVFGRNAKHLNISLCLARADSAAWQMGGQAWAQAEPKTRGWVWLTLKSGSASRCHLQRGTNQFQFQLQMQLQQFLCSLQPVYCDTYLHCLLYIPPLPPSLSCLSLCLSGLTEINLILYAVARLTNEPQLQSSDLHTD